MRSVTSSVVIVFLCASAHASVPLRDAAALEAVFGQGTAEPARVPFESVSTHFKVDAAGNVYWMDHFGNIRRNRASLGYPPATTAGFQIDLDGNIYHVDGFGTLRINGRAVRPDPHHGRFWITPAGNLYWIDPFTIHLLKNGEDTGYRASWRSPVREDASGRVHYVAFPEGRLHREGVDLGVSLDGADYWIDHEGNVAYLGVPQEDRQPLFVRGGPDGRQRILDWTLPYPRLVQDAENHLYYPGTYGQLRRDGNDLLDIRVSRGEFYIDRKGNVYHSWNQRIHRQGVDTGLASQGPFVVTPEGDIYHMIDRTWSALARNGHSLDLSIR